VVGQRFPRLGCWKEGDETAPGQGKRMEPRRWPSSLLLSSFVRPSVTSAYGSCGLLCLLTCAGVSPICGS